MVTDPLAVLLNVARGGGNPMTVIQQMAGQNNPLMSQAAKMMQGKNPQQIQSMVMNMCKERGVSVEQIAQSLGLNMPGK